MKNKNQVIFMQWGKGTHKKTGYFNTTRSRRFVAFRNRGRFSCAAQLHENSHNEQRQLCRNDDIATFGFCKRLAFVGFLHQKGWYESYRNTQSKRVVIRFVCSIGNE